MEQIAFEVALPADLCRIFGCDKCPGFSRVGDLPGERTRDMGWLPADPMMLLACVHECHRVPRETNLEPQGPGVTVTCPTCGAVATMPGVVDVERYHCHTCGRLVKVGEGPVQ